jgi:hypothetical protein
MTHTIIHRLLLSAVAVVLAVGAHGRSVEGYLAGPHTWDSDAVPYFVNPRNASMSESAAVSAVQLAAGIWNQASSANVELLYAGYTSGSALILNHRNEVFFRDGLDTSPVAETYSWWDDTGRLLDTDIVFYERTHLFFAFAGCSEGVYLESAAVHEFGHVLGLLHSPVPGATMSAHMAGDCDRTPLDLHDDDIAGLEAMYPPVSVAASTVTGVATLSSTSGESGSITLAWENTAVNAAGVRIDRSLNGTSFTQIALVGAGVTSYVDSGLASGTMYHYRVAAYNAGGASGPSNVASGTPEGSANPALPPVVTMINPVDGASYPDTSPISFSASAVDPRDGDLTARVLWTSSVTGSLGVGGSFTRSLPAGTHVITAHVEGTSGLRGSRQVTMTVTTGASRPAPQATLTAVSSSDRGTRSVTLAWSGLPAGAVEVRRDGSRVATASGASGEWVDTKVNARSHTYEVCNAGGAACTNRVTISF